MQDVPAKSAYINAKTADGRLVWQKYNCQSCHQLYGLGGYLGPDLTNVYSAEGKGSAFIKAFITSGTRQMPAFKMSSEEQQSIVEFLEAVDACGNAHPASYKVLPDGMIAQSDQK